MTISPSSFEFTVERLAEADELCARAAARYQDYVHQLKIFESLCKDFLAALKMGWRESGEKMSEVEMEARARASVEWRDFRAEQFKLLKEAGKRQIQYENAQRRWETARSGLSLRKEEAKRFIA